VFRKNKGNGDFSALNQKDLELQHEVFINEIKSNLNVDLEFARRHARADKIGYDDPNLEPFYCPCCSKNCNKLDFPADCDIEDLSIYGIGVTMYFKLMESLR
jgi:hypothetical protein